MPCEDRGRDWRDAATSQGTARTGGDHQKPARGKGAFYPESQREHDLTSGAVSESMSVVFSHLVSWTRLWRPQETNTLTYLADTTISDGSLFQSRHPCVCLVTLPVPQAHAQCSAYRIHSFIFVTYGLPIYGPYCAPATCPALPSRRWGSPLNHTALAVT